MFKNSLFYTMIRPLKKATLISFTLSILFSCNDYENETNKDSFVENFVPEKVYPSLVMPGLCSSCPLKVPQIIHQIWHTWKPGSKPTEEMLAFRDEIKRLHPEWKYVFWDNDSSRELIAQHYKFFLPIYDAYDAPIKRADAARYFILHNQGGVYLDMGFKAFKNLEPLLQGWDFIAAEQDLLEHSVNNAFMASIPAHPFLDLVIKNLAPKKDLFVLHATGPNFLTESLLEYQARAPQIKILDHKYIFPFAWHEANTPKVQRCLKAPFDCGQLYPEAFMFKKFAASWR
jgi:hypothetical protein